MNVVRYCWASASLVLLIWHEFSKEYCGRASMSECHRYDICLPIILSLTSHSALHVHKMQT